MSKRYRSGTSVRESQTFKDSVRMSRTEPTTEWNRKTGFIRREICNIRKEITKKGRRDG